MLKLIVSLALASVTFAAPGASLERRVDFPGTPPGFSITSLGVYGRGCPAGTTYYLLNRDKTAVTVTFSDFYAEAGPGIPISSNRKACQLAFGVIVPAGFSISISSVDYVSNRGSYLLDNETTATQQSTYYFQGETDQATARSTLTGPAGGDDYTFRDAFVSPVTSPCGSDTVLYINSDVRVSNSANPKAWPLAMVTELTFNFQSQTCET
ncbi:hypothetical protein EST38_g4908 [Candolleomyces aberdarensis]|uniref:Secreted protein n=1 Tax=Candolleomyces aberdarensis TaxID=2316362 RepID=A0A4Q2DNL7_9AGAR|nr:hypothetical protein EST38_g4908 [Candolleomyces aberdarensis]